MGIQLKYFRIMRKVVCKGKPSLRTKLIRKIIPNINEGLHAIHEAGIIHKDLKPSNIMLNSDGETVSIIDFGISSIVADGEHGSVTKTGMTPEYSAPRPSRTYFSASRITILWHNFV